MLWTARANVRKALLLLAVLAIAASACGGGGSAATSAPAGGGSGGGGGAAAGLANAGKNLSNVNSYKFRMEMTGGDWKSMFSFLNAFTGGSGDSFVVTGTTILKPEKASEMHINDAAFIEIGGKSYNNMLGSWTADTSSGPSMADGFAPDKLFAGFTSLGWKGAGDESKNGVTATHYTVAASEVAKEASLFGVDQAADWTCDMWVSKEGYVVGMALIAKSSGTEIYKFTMDITNINDPANKVEKPAVSGS